eukprot:TRINITY_DN29911_c0_g1_i1.p3 TRINITY_DN29911_c0_g1~~TRINITY_DN29911_c0_g1_i1.p3  ORF type:complete len:192 (-),score=30.77 TRINITY_DN29911_c0_g1_i1:673-1248(-)
MISKNLTIQTQFLSVGHLGHFFNQANRLKHLKLQKREKNLQEKKQAKKRGRSANKDLAKVSEGQKLQKSIKKDQSNVGSKVVRIGRAPRSSSKNKGTSLKNLLDAGILFPGEGKLTVNYRSQLYVGALSVDGIILFDGREFQSPSAFSVYAKRKVTPEKQGDDGWRSVHYEGHTLDSFRKKFLQQQQQSNG